MEHADRLALEASFDALERAVDDAFGDRLLAVEHDRIHELREDDVPELWIGKDFALFWAATTRHWQCSFLFSRFRNFWANPVRGLLCVVIWDAWRRTWTATGGGP